MPATLPFSRLRSHGGAPMTYLRRGIAVFAALPLLTLAACGYGSDSKSTNSKEKVAAGSSKIEGLASVKIGYFGNLTHATALVGREQGLFQKELGATKADYATFNAGPSEIEALNSGSIDIGWIGPSPRSTATPSPTARA